MTKIDVEYQDLAREVNRILSFVGASAMDPKLESANPFSGAYKWIEPNLVDTIRQMHAYYESPERELVAFLSMNNKSIGLLNVWDNDIIHKNEKGKIPLQDSCVSCTEVESDCRDRLHYFYNGKSSGKPLLETQASGNIRILIIGGLFFLGLLIWYRGWPLLYYFFKPLHEKHQVE